MTLIHICGVESYGYFELVEEIPNQITATALGIQHDAWKQHFFYAADGRKFGIRPTGGHELKPRWLWWIMANSVFNPFRKYRIESVDLGLHPLSEVKDLIWEWTVTDEDTITQFLDEEQIRFLLDRADNFDDVVLAIRAIAGEYEENDALKEELRRIGVPKLDTEE